LGLFLVADRSLASAVLKLPFVFIMVGWLGAVWASSPPRIILKENDSEVANVQTTMRKKDGPIAVYSPSHSVKSVDVIVTNLCWRIWTLRACNSNSSARLYNHWKSVYCIEQYAKHL